MNGSTTASTVSYLSDYRPEVDDLRARLAASQAEVTRLRAVVLDLSDAVDLTRQSADANARVLADEAYQRGQRNGYERGARTYSADWRAVVVPTVESAVMRLTTADLEARRYGPGGREQFGRPMPGDRTGTQILADARASWDAAGLDLAPAGMVYLNGPVVHHHQCSAVCRAYRPGWYSHAGAARILATLPGHYAATQADLETTADLVRAGEPSEGGA